MENKEENKLIRIAKSYLPTDDRELSIEYLANVLREMYNHCKETKNDSGISLIVFGVIYSKYIKKGYPKKILLKANMHASYTTEISKGKRLAQYLKIK